MLSGLQFLGTYSNCQIRYFLGYTVKYIFRVRDEEHNVDLKCKRFV